MRIAGSRTPIAAASATVEPFLFVLHIASGSPMFLERRMAENEEPTYNGSPVTHFSEVPQQGLATSQGHPPQFRIRWGKQTSAIIAQIASGDLWFGARWFGNLGGSFPLKKTAW